MKIVIKDLGRYILRFDQDEELIVGLGSFLESENIQVGHLTAIGTCTAVVLGWYDKEAKIYVKREFKEDLEVLALSGNVSVMDGRPAVHLHGSFSRRDFSAVGGHVFSMTIAITTEVNLVVLSGQAPQRKLNPEHNVNLLA